MLPLIAALRPQSSVQALVLLPTRELASQVAIVARRLAAASPERLLVMALLDGSGAKRQRKWLLAEPPQVVIGNVQQVDSVLRAKLLRLESLRYLVVDEVDACLDDAKTSALLQTMLSGQLALPAADKPRAGSAGRSSPLAARQTLFVSASLPQRQHFRRQCEQQRWCVPRLTRSPGVVTSLVGRVRPRLRLRLRPCPRPRLHTTCRCRESPVLVHAEPTESLPAQLRHGWAPCTPPKRVAALRVLLRRHEPEIRAAIVFVRPSMPLRRIAEAIGGLLDEGPPAILSEEEPLNERAAAIRAMREQRCRLLLATPLGGRGLDIPHCSHVYMLGLPQRAEDYLHQAGRCGRFGQPGLVTVLCAEKEEFALVRVANALNIQFFDARKDAPAEPT